jgi:hypothetical protein
MEELTTGDRVGTEGLGAIQGPERR